MSPDLNDAIQDIYVEHGWAHDIISAEVRRMLNELNRLRQQLDKARKALESIAKNTCCDKCQEAALVAQQAIKEIDND